MTQEEMAAEIFIRMMVIPQIPPAEAAEHARMATAIFFSRVVVAPEIPDEDQGAETP